MGSMSAMIKSKYFTPNPLLFMISLYFIVLAPLFAQDADMLGDAHIRQAGTLEKISLTAEENAWLAAHPKIELGFSNIFKPKVIKNDDGSCSGILIDYPDRALLFLMGVTLDYPLTIRKSSKAREVPRFRFFPFPNATSLKTRLTLRRTINLSRGSQIS